MSLAQLLPFANHLWQSTLFAGVAGLLTLGLRKNRARVRHWVWLAASCKFLIPLSVLMALGNGIEWRRAPEITPARSYVLMDRVGTPFTAPSIASTSVAMPATENSLPEVLLGIWACGFLGITCAWAARWRRIRAAVRAGSPVQVAIPIPAISSPALLEPGVFGMFRPVLLLPEGIFERLTPEQFKAVVAHELCHVRYLDNLAAALHMLVETVFWFHPLLWWMGKRMVEEREQSCDEEVLRMGGQPRVYADAILNVCKLHVESPLACVSGVAGSNLKKRIAAIMSNRVAIRLSLAKKAALAIVAIAVVTGPIIIGTMNAPSIRAQSATIDAPKFEVASIRACGSSTGPKLSPRDDSSPESLRLPCQPMIQLIQWAYVNFANDHYNPFVSIPISGGPAWINSAGYEVNAKAEGPRGKGTLNAPMLRALLEDRFKLRIHRETREIPVYALTVANGGPKLQPSKEGGCTPVNFDNPGPPPEEIGKPSFCGMSRVTNDGFDIPDATMATLSRSLSDYLDRNVIDETGIAGTFDIHLNLSAADLRIPAPGLSESMVPASPPPDAELKMANEVAGRIREELSRLGLKLVPTKGPGVFLVIDQVERPSEVGMMNAPAIVAQSTGATFATPGEHFEVASVRPSVPVSSTARVYFGPPHGGPGTRDPEQITWSYATLKGMLMKAYDLKAYQVSGPKWLDTERYDIIAKVPTGVTNEQVNRMWQKLIGERFGVALHYEAKEFQVYELVVAKGGPKLKPSLEADLDEEGPPKMDKGQLTGPGMVHFITSGGSNGLTVHSMAKAQPIAPLAVMLGNELNRPVIDKTGLTGKYDFDFEFAPSPNSLPPPPGASPADNSVERGPDLVTVLQRQLGLAVVPSKADLDVLVVDKAEKVPTAN